MAEQIRQRNIQAEHNRIEREMNRLLPLVNEANLAAEELERDVEFKTKVIKKIDLNNRNNHVKTELYIEVINNEDPNIS